jgi:hypothetical protein
MINGQLFLALLLIVLRFLIMRNIIPLKVLLLIFPAVQVVPDLRLGDRIVALFTLLCVLTACSFHMSDFY